MAHLSHDRHVFNIYENIENGAHKLALDQLAKVQKKNKIFPPIYMALKALALVRAGKDEDEAHALCDELLTLKVTEEHVLTLTERALNELHRPFDVTVLCDNAYKNAKDSSTALPLGTHAFMAHVKFGNWKGAQQVASKLYKATMEPRHAYWAAMCAALQSTDPTTPIIMRIVALRLALRIIETCPQPSWWVPDRLHLHADVLQAVGQEDGAFRLLDGTPEGRAICDRNPALDELRHDVSLSSGRWRKEGELARAQLLDADERLPEWDVILALINYTIFIIFPPEDGPIPPKADLTDEHKGDILSAAEVCSEILEQVAQRAELTGIAKAAIEEQRANMRRTRVAVDSSPETETETEPDEETLPKGSFFGSAAKSVPAPVREKVKNWMAELRTALLGKLELCSRLDAFGVSLTFGRAEIIVRYIRQLGHLPCTFDDLVRHIHAVIKHDGEEAEALTKVIAPLPEDIDTVDALNRTITKFKVQRALLHPEEMTEDGEVAAAVNYAKVYTAALELGKDLNPERDMQPANDLALMSAQAFVSAWKISGNPSLLLPAVCILERASASSLKSFYIRLHLVRVYNLLGCGASLSVAHYLAIGKATAPGSMSHDSIGYNVLARASTFAFAEAGKEAEPVDGEGWLAGGGAARMMQLCAETTQMYDEQVPQVGETIAACFQDEKYSQIQELIKFEHKLDRSLQRDLNIFEYARMALLWTELPNGPTLESFEPELLEIKAILTRVQSSNRDFAVLPSFQPLRGESFEAQTCIGPSKTPGAGWLRTFAKMYLRALATPELLKAKQPGVPLLAELGAAPPEPDNTWDEFIHSNVDHEMAELTQDEKDLIVFVDQVLTWAEPRVTPSMTTPPADDEELQAIVKSFDAAVARCEDLLTSGSAVDVKIFHAVTLVHERFVLFNMILGKLSGTQGSSAGKAKAKKPSRPAAFRGIYSQLRGALLRLPPLLLERSEKEDGAALEAQCDVIKDFVHIPSVVNRLAEARNLAYVGLGRAIASILAS
ncbi:hypothetical protein EXIGLDRAFT_828513 [Exidia glandulosa HHB12029]|uniref:Actin cytoskeleton organization protein n=1 Tax=Exidia glandulosa HHB12029 TaxID=1314781 RepID=A0A165QII0_EXIGL|nr:hypothetical protein EXIGLDRAFT_828513 [Exidia glandulosa HHB12029]